MFRKTAILLFVLVFCWISSSQAEIRFKQFSNQQIKAMANTKALIKTRLGNIEIEFFPDKAPNHVDNFIQLAKSGFYNGTTFHRIVPGFVIQGGDPNSKDAHRGNDGTGGPGYYLKAEFNDRPHRRGTLSMARSGHPDSAGSQFFICIQQAAPLNGEYTVFGQVIKGLEVIDRIAAEPTDPRDNPINSVAMQVTIVGP